MRKKSAKDPFRTLSRKTAGAVGNTPEVEAYRSGKLFVPNTWGGYATKAIDLELCEPNQDAVIALFGGREFVDLKSPKTAFETNEDFLWYKSRWVDAKTKWHAEDLKIERDRLLKTAQLILSQWEVDKAVATKLADALQVQIDNAGSEVDIDILCMKRDGLHDGIEVTLAEFASAMLTANILDEEFPSELAGSWIGGIADVIIDLQRDYGYIFDFGDRKISELPLSRDQIGGFLGAISSSHTFASYDRAQSDWEYIDPVFAAPTSLSILDGTEK